MHTSMEVKKSLCSVIPMPSCVIQNYHFKYVFSQGSCGTRGSLKAKCFDSATHKTHLVLALLSAFSRFSGIYSLYQKHPVFYWTIGWTVNCPVKSSVVITGLGVPPWLCWIYVGVCPSKKRMHPIAVFICIRMCNLTMQKQNLALCAYF